MSNGYNFCLGRMYFDADGNAHCEAYLRGDNSTWREMLQEFERVAGKPAKSRSKILYGEFTLYSHPRDGERSI